MDNKYKKVIETLWQSEKSLTSKELSYLLGVSQKTVRNYVAAINSGTETYIVSSNKGYTLQREQALKILEKPKNEFPQDQPERVHYIIKRLIQSSSNDVDLETLSEELLVSFETIKNDFIKVKEKLTQNNLFIHKKNTLVWIDGSERDKRKMLSKLLSGEFNKNLLNLELLESIFPNLNLKLLTQRLQELCKEYHYFINDYALLNLVLEVAIEIDRMQNDFLQSERHNYLSDFSEQELELIKKFAATLEEEFHIQYKNGEIKELANIVLSSLVKLDYSVLTSNQLHQVLDTRSIELMQLLNNQMKKWELFDVENEGFLVKFSLHIKNLLDRLETGYVLKNPLTSHIKTTCPLIFEHAIEIGNTIAKFAQKAISEDEVTFLALHIGNIVGENDYLNERIKCIISLPSYYDYSYRLIDKIKSEFEQDLVINEIVSTATEIDSTNNDLVISVGAYLYHTDLSVTQVTPFFTNNDRNNIQKAIEKTKLLKKRHYLRKHLYQVTEPALFSEVTTTVTKQSVLTTMCRTLIQKGYVKAHYLDDVFEREKQSSTAFGKVAVPHSFNMDASKTSMSILIAPNGIQWDDHNIVHIILLFAIKKEERALFFNIFDSIVTKLIEPQYNEAVIKSKSLDELINNFLDCL